MHTTRNAFTIVEALVATTIIGIASAALAISLAANSRLRGRAAARIVAARVATERLGFLSARPCAAADTAGTASSAGTSEAWTARRTAGGWTYTDSIAIPPTFHFRSEGAVPCRP